MESGKIFGETEVLRILRHIGQILYELENRYIPPIIHRDIKPSNILYHRMGEDCEVYLIDFGAVANPQKQSGGSTIAGTFGYMAPEQLQGNAAIQSDYYGAGATALHLLTGVSPCDIPADVFRLEFDDVLAQKAPKLTRHAAQLLHILLAPRIEDRPANATELLTMVRNVMEGRAVNENKKKSWLGKLFEGLERGSDSAKWPKCQGIIRDVRTIRDNCLNVIEYSYAVEGKTYCGFFRYPSEPDIIVMGEGVHPPDEKVQINGCIVRYNPRSPQRGLLPKQTIYVSRTILEKLFSLDDPLLATPEDLLQFAKRLCVKEKSAAHALLYILFTILTQDLAQYDVYRSGVRSFLASQYSCIQELLEIVSATSTVTEDSIIIDARLVLNRAAQLSKRITPMPLRNRMVELWMIAQKMDWSKMRQLLEKTYDVCAEFATQFSEIVVALDVLLTINRALTVKTNKRVASRGNEVKETMKEMLWNFLTAADHPVDEEPMQYLHDLFGANTTKKDRTLFMDYNKVMETYHHRVSKICSEDDLAILDKYTIDDLCRPFRDLLLYIVKLFSDKTRWQHLLDAIMRGEK